MLPESLKGARQLCPCQTSSPWCTNLGSLPPTRQPGHNLRLKHGSPRQTAQVAFWHVSHAFCDRHRARTPLCLRSAPARQQSSHWTQSRRSPGLPAFRHLHGRPAQPGWTGPRAQRTHAVTGYHMRCVSAPWQLPAPPRGWRLRKSAPANIHSIKASGETCFESTKARAQYITAWAKLVQLRGNNSPMSPTQHPGSAQLYDEQQYCKKSW